MILFNEQLNIDDLPKVENLVYQPLEKRYLKVLLISNLLLYLALGIAIVAFLIFKPFEVEQFIIYLAIAIYFFLFFGSFLSRIFGFKNKAYALRQRDIVYKHGWLWKTMTTVSFNRVQHVSIDQGPIERKMELSKLNIYTAGGSSSDMTIPGLNPETAHQLKDYIVKKTASDEEE